MKKPKIDLSKQGLKDFFFRHTEKLFFGLAVALIGLFFWIGLKTPTYTATTPTAMLQLSQQAGARIEDSGNWAKMAEFRTPITDASERIAKAEPLDSSKLAYDSIIGTGVASLEKRTDPALLKPGPLQTSYLRAQIALKVDSKSPVRDTKLDKLPVSVVTLPDNQKGETFAYRGKGVRGQTVYTADAVIGMALIDYEAQVKAYRETFRYQRGYDVNRDVPVYAFVEVQRKTETTDWVPLLGEIYKINDKLDGAIKDLIKDEHSLRYVTMDIPPFLGLDYREFVTLPEMERERAVDYAINKEEKSTEDAPPVNPGDVFSIDDSSKDDAESAKADEADKAKEEEKMVKYRLIRFFDLTNKKAGEKYYYRVRLWFRDPNNPDNFTKEKAASDANAPERAGGAGGGGNLFDGDGGGGDGGESNDRVKVVPKAPLSRDDISPPVRKRLLQPVPDIPGLPEEIGGVKTKDLLRTVLPGEWVESTQPVTATKGFETFIAGPIDAPTSNRVGAVEFYQTDPEATIVANSFQDDLGVFVPAKTTQLPGSVLNFRAVTYVLHPLLGTVRDVFDSIDSRGQKTGRMFETDAILVDAMGGQRQTFSRKPDTFYTPAEVIIMDRNGRLIIRNDMDDETSFRHATFESVLNSEKLAAESGKKPGDDDKGDDDRPSR